MELFRNVPLLVQLFLWFFVLPELLPEAAGTWLKRLPNAPFWTAAIGLGLYMSARVAEQVRAGLDSLPRGQRLAGTAQYEFSLIGPNGASEPVGLPGQIILVPTSFFRQATDEAEFAAMVAHAMAHVTLRHGWAPPVYWSPHTMGPNAYREQARRNELEADRHAVEITARAGYDAAALSTYLRRIKADPDRLAALEQRTPPGGELGGTEYVRLQQIVGVPKLPTLKR